MPKSPFFSIVIANRNEHTALEHTLTSIQEQKEVTVEVVVVDASTSDQGVHLAQKFIPLVSKISLMMRYQRFKMYNRGLKLAKGAYVLFLLPGDLLISPYTLKILHQLIQKTQAPDVVLGENLYYDLAERKRKVGSLSLESLRRGQLPTDLCASCFKRNRLLEVGGFMARWHSAGGLELFCRLHTYPEVRFVTTTRVLTDNKLDLLGQGKYGPYNIETPKVIAKYFGWMQALFYLLTHNYFLLLRYWLKNIRFSQR